jgi:hypothetical protein
LDGNWVATMTVMILAETLLEFCCKYD